MMAGQMDYPLKLYQAVEQYISRQKLEPSQQAYQLTVEVANEEVCLWVFVSARGYYIPPGQLGEQSPEL